MKTILAFCFACFFALGNLYSQSQCDPVRDSLALVAIYDATDGPNWLTNDNWLSAQPISNWAGVGLNAASCVDSLNLRNFRLKGDLPADIGALEQLEHLDLYANSQLSGLLPPEIGNLTDLKILQLGFLQLESLPTEIGMLTNLEYLSMRNTRLTSIPNTIGNLRKLKELNMNNNFEEMEPLPFEIGDLDSLEILFLGQCKFTGIIPPTLGNLTKLRELNIFGSRLEGSIPAELGNLENLEILNLNNNRLTGPIPLELENLTNLVNLGLNSNQLTSIPPEIGNLHNLTNLQIGDNNLSGPIPPELGQLSSLQGLYLKNNNLSGPIPPELGNLDSSILFINLAYNNLSGPIPPELGNLTSLGNSLDLSYNKLTGSIPKELSFLTNLSFLSLDHNNLSGPVPPELGNLDLSSLKLNSNQLSGPIPPELGNLNFSTLDLHHNNFSGSIPEELGNMTKLKRVYLDNNQLGGSLPSGWGNLALTEVNLEQNVFTFDMVDDLFTIPINANEVLFLSQNPFFKDSTYYVLKGSSLEIDLGIDTAISNNQYEWKKDDQNWQPTPGNNPNSNKLLFPDIQSADVGSYQAFVTNGTYTSVTFQSHPIHVRVCDVAADSLELVKLYNATGGANWDVSTNWLQAGQPFSNWQGISTDALGCVSKIDLRDNKLNGALPNLELNTLDTLILSGNALMAAIPEWQMPDLLHLDLSQNSFQDTIPVLDIRKVEYLNLSGNLLDGTIPTELGNLNALRVLNLADNTLTGNIPPEIGNLTELAELRLNNNMLAGELPLALTRLQNLEIGRVSFANNQIDSLMEQVVFFCPYGDQILQNNPSHTRFLNLCNADCTGNELNDLFAMSWIVGTLNAIPCPNDLCAISFGQAGFVELRGIKLFFVRVGCAISSFGGYAKDVMLYDCGGNLLDSISCDRFGDCTGFNTISQEEFCELDYDIRWNCGQTIPMVSAVEEPNKPVDWTNTKGTVPITVRPNPTSSEVSFINQPGMKLEQIQCINLWGQQIQVSVRAGLESTTVDLQTDVPGMYLLFIPGEGRMYTAKVVKQ